jgi:hypothetical protein
MKKIAFFLLFSALCGSVQAQTSTETKAPETIEFKEVTYDFGKIPQGKPVYHSFELVNKSSGPIKVDNVQASCGCTTPEWSKEPIAAGSASTIKVGYNAAAEGPFEKFITVQYNGNQTKQIIIKGTVWKAPVGAAPTNASIQFLKSQIQ